MFAIYQDTRNGTQSIGPAVTASELSRKLDAMSVTWKLSKVGRTAKRDGLTVSLMFSDGKLASVIYADPVPVPAVEPDKQPRRGKGATLS